MFSKLVKQNYTFIRAHSAMTARQALAVARREVAAYLTNNK